MRRFWSLLWASMALICISVGLLLFRSHDALAPFRPHVRTLAADVYAFQVRPTDPYVFCGNRKSLVSDTSLAEVDRVMKAAYPAAEGWSWRTHYGFTEGTRGLEEVSYITDRSSPSTIVVNEMLKLTWQDKLKLRMHLGPKAF